MNEGYITREEHEEFRRGLEAENHRQNRRIEILEKNTKEINSLIVSVEKLAQNIESMVRVQETQGEQLEELRARDGKMWRKVTGYIITAIIGIVIGYIFKQLGM